MKWILSLFLCLSASAQLPVIPFVLKSAAAPDPISIGGGLAYWWNFTDLSTGATVTAWTDRVAQLSLSNTAPTKCPVNTSLGVAFKGSSWITNSQVICSNLSSVVIIVSPTNTDGASEFHIFGDMADSFTYRVFAGKYAVQTTQFALAVSNVCVDLYLSTKDPDGTQLKAATNGIIISGISSFTGTGGNIGALGPNSADFSLYRGYIREYLVYTNENIVTNSALMAAIHKYVTNTYSDIRP